MKETYVLKLKIKNLHWAILLFLFIVIPNNLTAQENRVDSLLVILKEVRSDTKLDTLKLIEGLSNLLKNTDLNDAEIRNIEKNAAILDQGKDQDLSYLIKISLFNYLINYNPGSAISYGQKTLRDLDKSKTPHAKMLRNAVLADIRIPYRNSSQLEEGFKYFNTRLQEFSATKDSSGLATAHYVLSGFYSTTGLYDESIYHLKKANSYTNKNPNYDKSFFGLRERNISYFEIQNTSVIADNFLYNGDMQSALEFNVKALEDAKKGGKKYVIMIPYVISNLLKVKLATNELKDIPILLKTAKELSDDPITLAALMQQESHYYIKTKSFDLADSLLTEIWNNVKDNNIVVVSGSGIIKPDHYRALLRIEQNRPEEALALLEKDNVRLGNLREEKLRNYRLQALLYQEIGDYKNAFLINEKYLELQGEIQTDTDKYRRVSFEVEQDLNQKELSITTLQAENKISSITQKFSVGLALMFILLSSMIYYRFQSKKKAHIVLESTLSNLKITQSQLIQSEKMASLGELTAGIAHEIQNPLNFVNNFADVSDEMLDELKEELAKGDISEVISLTNEVQANLKKITHHGKRADAIVKGMLEHSRRSTGEKVPTNINTLADEYLRLSYHGLRAKDKSFNADFNTDFDPDLPKVNVIPQDIGRVLLNLINNAFQAISETDNPKVTVATKKVNDTIHISVSDNGPGIPDDIKDKIFQPFFTTKPSGQGTGLGLSLSYDIIKAHGGELKVEIKEGAGTKFTIHLPKIS